MGREWIKSAQERWRWHQRRGGPRRRRLSAQACAGRRGAWEANPQTCRRIASPRPPHERIREKKAEGRRGRVEGGGGSREERSAKDARGAARSLGPLQSQHTPHPRRRARSLAPAPSSLRGPPPPLPLAAPAADLSAPLPAPLPALAAFPAACSSLLSSDGDGGGGRPNLQLPPPAWTWRTGRWGALRLTSSSGSRELSWRFRVLGLG